MAVKKIPMQRIREQYKKLNIDRRWFLLLFVLLVLSFFINIWPFVFLMLFSVANALLLSIDRYVQAPLDLEFSTFSAVLMTMEYNVKWGIAAAILTKIAGIIYNRNVRMDHLFMVIGYIIAAITASLFSGMGVASVGIISTLVVNLYIVFVSRFITMLSTYEIIMYGSSNTIFNIVLFIGFGDLFRILMF